MPVYIVRAGDTDKVKIGFATDVPSRRSKMQTDNHERLKVLRVLVGGEELEDALHARFDVLRSHGDWFTFSPEMMGDLGCQEFIAERKPPKNQSALALWLWEQEIPLAAFAEAIGVKVQTVHRYLNGERIPRPEVMDKIQTATGGKVQPNDFFARAA